jgi:hypothetical protein
MFATVTDMAGTPDGHREQRGERPGADALVGLLGVVPADLTDGEVTDALLDLVELSGRVHSALARFTASFDARSLASVDGARSVSGWVAARSELSRPAAVGALACGRALRHCPVVDAAATDGRLGVAKVRMLLDARDRVEELFAAHETALVGEVAPLTVEAARRHIDAWREVALATLKNDGPAPGDDSDLNGVHLSSTFQKRWRLDGDLDDLTGDGIANALDAWIDARIRGVLDPTSLSDPRCEPWPWPHSSASAPRPGHRAPQRRADIRLTWDAADLWASRRRSRRPGPPPVPHRPRTHLTASPPNKPSARMSRPVGPVQPRRHPHRARHHPPDATPPPAGAPP